MKETICCRSFFLFNPNSRFFSPGFLWLSLLLIRGVRHLGEGGGGGSWESNYFSLFSPKRFLCLSSTRVLWADGREGGWAAEMYTRTWTQTWCPGTGGRSFLQAFALSSSCSDDRNTHLEKWIQCFPFQACTVMFVFILSVQSCHSFFSLHIISTWEFNYVF